MMFNSEENWNISFAGCGFRSIYYLGAFSCVLENVPRLVQGASKICGASSGCLVAAALAVGIPIEQCCANLMSMAVDARKYHLGVFHPTFNLLQKVKDFLLISLPGDAHILASGKLCVSLTRMHDGRNVLVSDFNSREELIQVLICSCFFPVYCGLIPPSYRGVRYIDGALSNNMPLLEQRNTITVAPFSGENDICPKEGTFNFMEVHFGNINIQANTDNVLRILTAFCPPGPEMLAKICHDGYMDALHFLTENKLLSLVLVEVEVPKPPCCEYVDLAETREIKPKKPHQNGLHAPPKEHWWLDQKRIENLPLSIKKSLCEACREGHRGGGLLSQVTEILPVKVLSYILMSCFLPIELVFLLAQSMTLLGWTFLQTFFLLCWGPYQTDGGGKWTGSKYASKQFSGSHPPRGEKIKSSNFDLAVRPISN